MKSSILPVMAITLAMVVMTSGCIDIYLLKDLTITPKKTVVVYGWVEKAHASHSFLINLTDANPSEAKYNTSVPFNVTEGAKKIKLWLNINMMDLGLIDQLPVPPSLEPIIENLSAYLHNVRRHVDIYIYTPYGELYWYGSYNYTVNLPIIVAENPRPGSWLMEIDATGIGFGHGTQDSFEIEVSVLEPTGTEVIEE